MIDRQQDEAALAALNGRYLAAIMAKDIDALMGLYADEEVVFFDAVPPREYVGAELIAADWRYFFNKIAGRLVVASEAYRPRVSGDMAYALHFDRYVGYDPAGTQRFEATVRVTSVYIRAADEWRILHDHHSFPVDLNDFTPDLQSRAVVAYGALAGG